MATIPAPQPPPVDPVDFDNLTTEQRVMLFSANTSSQLLSGGENICYSPLSLYMALAMVSMGAEGDTLDQLLEVMQMSGVDAAALADSMAGIMRRLPFAYGDVEESEPETDASGVPADLPPPPIGEEPGTPHSLSIANSVWVNKTYQLLPGFEEVVTQSFQATAQNVDFSDPATAGMISQWVNEQTNGLLNPQYLFPDDMGLALVNTIYLADSWVEKFYEGDNTDDVFYLADGDTTDCTYMYGSWDDKFYLMGDGYSGLSLGLNGSSNAAGSMTFILPDEGVSPESLLKDPMWLFGVMTGGYQGTAEVTLRLPKFSFDNTLQPIHALQILGVEALFDNADLPGLAEPVPGYAGNPLYVSTIQQDCHIAIDEEGIEAAAATMMAAPELGVGMEELKELELIFNRPFIFIVSYNDLPLFTGVVANPISEGS